MHGHGRRSEASGHEEFLMPITDSDLVNDGSCARIWRFPSRGETVPRFIHNNGYQTLRNPMAAQVSCVFAHPLNDYFGLFRVSSNVDGRPPRFRSHPHGRDRDLLMKTDRAERARARVALSAARRELRARQRRLKAVRPFVAHL